MEQRDQRVQLGLIAAQYPVIDLHEIGFGIFFTYRQTQCRKVVFCLAPYLTPAALMYFYSLGPKSAGQVTA